MCYQRDMNCEQYPYISLPVEDLNITKNSYGRDITDCVSMVAFTEECGYETQQNIRQLKTHKKIVRPFITS